MKHNNWVDWCRWTIQRSLSHQHNIKILTDSNRTMRKCDKINLIKRRNILEVPNQSRPTASNVACPRVLISARKRRQPQKRLEKSQRKTGRSAGLTWNVAPRCSAVVLWRARIPCYVYLWAASPLVRWRAAHVDAERCRIDLCYSLGYRRRYLVWATSQLQNVVTSRSATAHRLILRASRPVYPKRRKRAVL